ncbi:MAG: hypothetical protein M3071_03250 [Actinomycetota bacterium]|nr:hypothetical protein [Actinomycetota bacterium]
MHIGYASVWPAFVITGVGYGMTSTPMAAAVLAAAPATRAGMASSTNNAARPIGGVFGIAIHGSLLPAGGGSSARFISGVHAGLIAPALCAGLGAGGRCCGDSGPGSGAGARSLAK